MRASTSLLLAFALLMPAACTGPVDEPLAEEPLTGERECWVDDDCAIVREVSGCCAGCPGVVPRQLAEVEPCLVIDGDDAPAACFDAGCTATPACGHACLEPVGAVCTRGQCLALFDCGEANTAPVGSFCRE